MLQKGAVEVVVDPGLGFYSRFFPSGKSDWRIETRDRPFPLERMRQPDTVQNGDSIAGTVGHAGRRLPSIDRSEGRVLPGTHPQIIEQVPSVPFWCGRVQARLNRCSLLFRPGLTPTGFAF